MYAAAIGSTRIHARASYTSRLGMTPKVNMSSPLTQSSNQQKPIRKSEIAKNERKDSNDSKEREERQQNAIYASQTIAKNERKDNRAFWLKQRLQDSRANRAKGSALSPWQVSPLRLHAASMPTPPCRAVNVASHLDNLPVDDPSNI